MIRIVIAAVLASLTLTAAAKEVSGVELPDRVEVDGATLQLNGAGLRKKFVIAEIYVAGLYVAQPTRDADAVIGGAEPRRVTLVMKRKLGAETFMKAFHEGIEKNLGDEQLQALRPKLDQLDALFREVGAVDKGDKLHLDFVAGGSTRIVFEGRRLDAIPGEDLAAALLKIWLGEHPVQSDLKRAMLGE